MSKSPDVADEDDVPETDFSGGGRGRSYDRATQGTDGSSLESSGTFRVSPDEKRMLLESIGQADRGEFVDADDLLAELDESN